MAMKLLVANNAYSTLASGISPTDTTLTVASGAASLFPVPVSGESYFLLTLKLAASPSIYEIVQVTAVSGDTLTIVRAQEGTTAATWASGAVAANLFTAGSFGLLVQGTALSADTGAEEVGTEEGTTVQDEINRSLRQTGTFADGGTITYAQELYAYGGMLWRWGGALPKTVTAGATPSTDGIGVSLWSEVGSEQLKADLASGTSGKGTSLVTDLAPYTGAVAVTQNSINGEFVTPERFGAIGDGTTHLLSERYSTLAAAQAIYPFVTALTQSIDYAACQAALNTGRVKLGAKIYRLTDGLTLTLTTSLLSVSIVGYGEGASRLQFVNDTAKGISISLANDKNSKFHLEGFSVEATSVPTSGTAQTGIYIDGTAQIVTPGTSTTLATLGYRTDSRGTIEHVNIAGVVAENGAWYRGLHLNSIMNFEVRDIAYCGYVASSGTYYGEAITVSGDGYVVDFSFSRIWIYFCNVAFNFPDYVEGFHLYDFELVNVNIGFQGGIVQSTTVVPTIAGSITSPGVLSPWVHDGHMNAKQNCILLPSGGNHAKFHALELHCNPLSTDTQGRAAINMAYADMVCIDDVYILMDSAANTAYLDDNSGVFLGACIHAMVNNVRVAGVANRAQAIYISSSTTNSRIGNIYTNCKYGIAEASGSNQDNVLGPVLPGFGTARINMPTNKYENSYVYDMVDRKYDITLTPASSGASAYNYFNITPISTLSAVPEWVNVQMADNSLNNTQGYFDYANSTASSLRIAVRSSALTAATTFTIFVSYPMV